MKVLLNTSLIFLICITAAKILVPIQSAQAQGCEGDALFLEQDGIVIGEMESVAATGTWTQETTFAGFAGDGYFRWASNANSYDTPGVDILTYVFQIENPGKYRFAWRNIVGRGNNITEHNDGWLAIYADDFYAETANGQKLRPNNPNLSGAKAEDWFKVYDNGRTLASEWSTDARTGDNQGYKVYAEFDNPGVYSLQISGRSIDYVLDRWFLFSEDAGWDQASLEVNEQIGETLCDTPNFAPTVLSISPGDGETEVGRWRTIEVTFSEPVTPSGNWFTFTCPPPVYDYAATDADVNITQDGNTYTIDPPVWLPRGYTCTLTIRRGRVVDASGNSLTGDNTFNFTLEEEQRIYLESYPQQIAPDGDIVITFGQNVNNRGNWFRINCPSLSSSIFSGQASVSGNGNTRTINPNNDLPAGDTCNIGIYSVTSSATGQSFCSACPNSFSFDVVDGPQLISVSPSGGATGIDPNTDLTLTFDQEVFAGAGNLRIEQTDGTNIEEMSVASQQVTVDGDTVIVNPNSLLNYGTSYTLIIDEGAFVDVKGNPFAGLE